MLMRTTKLTEVLVVDDGKLVGTLNEHDIWQHCPSSALLLDDQQRDALLEQIRVGGVMTLHPPTITLDTSLREAAQLFATSHRHGLPVLEDGVPIGLLTEERGWQALAAVLEDIEHSTQRQPD
jgi:CBS domain-containing protein